jgi:hypothetical protein
VWQSEVIRDEGPVRIVPDEIIMYALEFREFSIEIDVDVTRSTEDTLALSTGKTGDAVFVSGDVWLRSGGARHLIINHCDAPNLLDLLEDLANAFRRPPSLPEYEALEDGGSVCAWMEQYWSRVEEERTSLEDEENHERLLPLFIVANGARGIAVYTRAGVLTVEAAGLTQERGVPTRVLESFSPEAVVFDVLQLQEAIGALVLQRTTMQ